MKGIRYYHLIEDMETGQIIIEKYATISKEEAMDGGAEMRTRFQKEYTNTDKEVHRLMSEGALEELRTDIAKALRETRYE